MAIVPIHPDTEPEPELRVVAITPAPHGWWVLADHPTGALTRQRVVAWATIEEHRDGDVDHFLEALVATDGATASLVRQALPGAVTRLWHDGESTCECTPGVNDGEWCWNCEGVRE